MSDTLRCSKCQRDLPVDDFSRDNRAPGRGCRTSWCRECYRVHSQLRRERNRQLIREAKDVPCMDGTMCGGKRFPYHVMDLDHVRGEKKFSLSDARTHSAQQVKDEIAKCDPVCANCHRERTQQKKQFLAPDGRPYNSRDTQTSPPLPDAPTLF